MSKLSVVLATYNEAENIQRCLKSVKKIADEIIIVDGNSTDNTRDLAQQLGAKVIQTTNKPIFHINKQLAVDAAKHDWVLSLDADEEVSSDLAKEISAIIQMDESQIRSRQLSPKKRRLFDRHLELLVKRGDKFNQNASTTVAFFVPRLNMFLGKAMRHTGVYPDGVIRLFRKSKAKYPAKSVHEQLEVTGRVDWLEHDLIHYDSPTFSKYLTRANRYTSLTSTELAQLKIPLNWKSHLNYLLIKPKITFLNLYIRHKGFLDGFPGFVFSLMSGLHWPIAYMKYYANKKAKPNKN